MEEEQKKNEAAGDEDVEMVPDEEASAPDAVAKVAKLREALSACEALKREYLDGWQRAKADLSNYKKEESRRFEEFAKFAAEGLIAEAITVLDSFDLALVHGMPKDVERGIVLTRSQLEDALRRRGLETIRAKSGERFDPALHEAIGEVESEDEEGMVAEELQKGYLLNGKVIRPARVKISKKKI